ncbi:filamentous hemagglutinin N-terminal domain-containing protein [Mesorhizobium sp. BH1-1-5]|uniref:MBG domain-containing protein n=1 Tax=Mesorhizobium sp. BH1-1-5 TaxID=2876661 RepID=UPI001CCFCDAE|nr:MBG domain-containing protein [Mesorhizobium sp. BH1-1-5]MBZ9988118.1 filamentous hemagglutinin N-terminal domain-containing protein [Mesorhizobium sp. BH1-1-5]
MRDTFPLFRTVNLPLTALLLGSTALVGFTSARAQELPTGGSVASGGVTISKPSSSQLAIKQSTNSAIVNWQSFSIGAGARVDIDQPNSSSVMLNRVTGNTRSTIAGQLNANGQVFLVNPNGIAISKTGKVSAAGFVGSSLDIDDEDFKAGKLRFKGKGASAAVTNEGSVSIGSGGYAALIGGSVDNSGTISVPLGKVGLGSGEEATLDLSGDGFLQVAVPTRADGSSALVSNSGVISADGGRVEIKAAAAKEAARQAVNMSGLVEARTVSGQSGEIVLGGADGSVEVSGKLDVSAKASGQGGKVTVTGRKLKLKGAVVDASGKDGGTVKIGGDKQGSGPLQRAETTEIDKDTVISADATGNGDGGTVIVWSDEQTAFAGKISARGGDVSGNGGFVEVSGKQRLDFTGSADLRARFGYTGDLLLDPYNVTISNVAGNTGGSMSANANDSVINVTTLQNLLATANVTISTGSGGSQAGDITVAAPITWSTNTLTLDAYHSIVFNADATLGGVGGLSLVTNHGGSGGTISYALGASATFTGAPGAQALSINGQSYTLIYDVNGLQAINSGLTGRYALARNIDASATSSWNAGLGFISLGTDGNSTVQNGGNGFTGTFDGLGHAIDKLSVLQPSAQYVGLFGYVGAGGLVQNVGVTDATIRGNKTLGAIAGLNAGTVTQVYSTGQLFTTGYGSVSGGLIGENDGALSDSFSTVIVSARDTNTAGGAVGTNGYSGTIDRVYASGAVDIGSGGAAAGGLIGSNSAIGAVGGRVTDSYATGAVSGGAYIGGFIGANYFQSVVSGAYDTTTSGGKPAIGYGTASGADITIVGLSTSSFQNGGASGLSASYGGGVGGLYPYLKSFYPNGVQAISGIAYKDAGATVLSSGVRQPAYVPDAGLVSVVSGGVNLGTVSTGVNGYYYLALPTGTVSNSVVAYTVANPSSGAKNGATFRTGLSGGNISNLNVYGDWRVDEADGSIASLSALNSAYASAVGSTSVGSLSFANRQIETAATTFALDQALSVGSGTLALSSSGTVTQTGGLTAASLWLGGTGSFSLTNAGNQVGAVGGNAGSVDLQDGTSLTVARVTNARGVATNGVSTSGSAKLRTTGDLTIAANATVSGADPVLSGAHFINNRGSDAVTATSGRWLAYAAGPDGNTFGNLDSDNTAIWNTAAGGAVGASGNRYVFAYQPTLTFTSDNASKVYGDAMPALSYSVSGYQAGVANAYLGDSALTAYSGTPTLSAPNTLALQQLGAGTYTITIDAGDVAAQNGYALAFNSTGQLSVAKRAVAVTATPGQSKTYGDADPSSYGYTYSDLGTGASLVGTLSRDAGENAGSYAIGQGTLTSANNANYDISYVGADFTIDKRAVTVTVDQGQSKIYGNADPSLYTYSVSNLDGGVTLTGSLDRVAGENAGTYAIGEGTLDVSNSNYDIAFVGADFTIAKRAITVTADAKGRAYGDVNPALTYQVTSGNLVGSDSLIGSLATSATTASGVGTYGITQGTLDNGNYAISYVGADLTVAKRAIAVTADAKSRTYGDSNPALTYQITSGNLVGSDSLIGSLATSATTASGVGTYGITQGTLDNGNYAISYVGADLTVGKRAITVTADAKNRVYGDGNPALTYQVTAGNLIGSDVLTGSLATTATATSDVGTYGIAQGTLDNGNYAISYIGADLTVGKRSVTVTATAGQGKTYGNADPSSYSYAYSDLGGGAALVGALDRAAGENAGGYAIGRGTLTDAANSNYDITFVGADFTIAKRAITVTADAQGRRLGMPNPPLTYTIGGLGLVDNDSLTGALATDATTASAPGSYAIEQGSLSASANYELTYVGANLAVQPSNVLPTVDAASTVAFNAGAHGSGQPAPVFFTGLPAQGDTQTLVVDPRFDSAAFCQRMAEAASVCASALVQ